MVQMSELAKWKSEKKEDSIETFGKFVADQLCDILIASKDCVFRRARRKIQQVLMGAWNAVDLTSSKSSWPSTQLLDMLDSSHKDEVRSLQPVSLVEQSFSKNVIFEPYILWCQRNCIAQCNCDRKIYESLILNNPPYSCTPVIKTVLKINM